MSSTKAAIKASFVKLLQTRPLKDLTVKEIVQDCGVNRNSFYYHFKDLPALGQEVVTERFQEILASLGPELSLPALLDAAAQEAQEHRQLLLHLSQGANWGEFSIQLLGLCREAVEVYAQKAMPAAKLRTEDREVLLRFYQCASYGQIVAWLSEGARGDLRGQLRRLCELAEGMPETMLRRAQEEV